MIVKTFGHDQKAYKKAQKELRYKRKNPQKKCWVKQS